MKRFFSKRERGATTVEFAIIFVLLISVLFGIIEFGILLYDNHILTNASREGARAGVVMRNIRLSDAEIKAIVEDYAADYMVSFGSSSTLNISIFPPEAARTGPSLFGTELVVDVKYPFNFLILSGFGVGPKTLTARTVMRME